MKKWLKSLFGRVARAALDAAVQTAQGEQMALMVDAQNKEGEKQRPATPDAAPEWVGGMADALAARKQFRQWPPAPDEIAPGEGGGFTKGVGLEHLAVLGRLWCGLMYGSKTADKMHAEREQYHREMHGCSTEDFETPGYLAFVTIGQRFGWQLNRKNPAPIEPDQFYTVRAHLMKWALDGVEPAYPTAGDNANAAHAYYNQSVKEANKPWQAPEQKQEPDQRYPEMGRN
jgi:hypothetical protein